MCNVCHVGSILTLHIECDLDHVMSSEEGDLELGDLTIDSPLRTAESLCNSSLEYAEQQQAKYNDLEAKKKALQAELDTKSSRLKRKLAIAHVLTKKAEHLGSRVKELILLSERHKVHIRGLHAAIELRKQTIAKLESQIREQGAGQA
ncbi:hypothetical protein GGF42_003670 [Coemansia sp. RSA 2424]|nr:hypothetical protein GGF42_003670 [Coemansia sp. RSA 2424]